MYAIPVIKNNVSLSLLVVTLYEFKHIIFTGTNSNKSNQIRFWIISKSCMPHVLLLSHAKLRNENEATHTPRFINYNN